MRDVPQLDLMKLLLLLLFLMMITIPKTCERRPPARLEIVVAVVVDIVGVDDTIMIYILSKDL